MANLGISGFALPTLHITGIQRLTRVVVHEEPGAKILGEKEEKLEAEVICLLILFHFLEDNPVAIIPLPVRH